MPGENSITSSEGLMAKPFDHTPRQFHAAGTQDVFAESSERPMARHL
jgi:hypothetical protein